LTDCQKTFANSDDYNLNGAYYKPLNATFSRNYSNVCFINLQTSLVTFCWTNRQTNSIPSCTRLFECCRKQWLIIRMSAILIDITQHNLSMIFRITTNIILVRNRYNTKKFQVYTNVTYWNRFYEIYYCCCFGSDRLIHRRYRYLAVIFIVCWCSR